MKRAAYPGADIRSDHRIPLIGTFEDYTMGVKVNGIPINNL